MGQEENEKNIEIKKVFQGARVAGWWKWDEGELAIGLCMWEPSVLGEVSVCSALVRWFNRERRGGEKL